MAALQGNQMGKFRSRGFLVVTGVLLGLVSAAAAKNHDTMKAGNKPRVVAHIEFDGMSQVDMTIQARPDNQYLLYVQHSNGKGVSVIDISKPEKPKAVAALTGSDATRDGRISISGNLAIVSNEVVASSRSSEFAKDELAVWDTSDPSSPRLVQRFSKVVKWARDDREFIYVLADDGLWIVSQPEKQASNTAMAAMYGVD